MQPIEKCQECPRFKLYKDSNLILDSDTVCGLCQLGYSLTKINWGLENELASLQD